MFVAAVFAGVAAGLGALLVVREFVPGHPHLASALLRLSGAAPDTGVDANVDLDAAHGAGPASGIEGRLGRQLGRQLDRHLHGRAWVRVPVRELAMVRTSRSAWLGQKALFALVGLLFPPVFTLAVGLAGLRLPVAVPLAASLALAAALWFVPDADVRVRARTARADFARAVTAYIDLTALERAGGSGATQALERAATVGDSWAFERLREALQRARWTGTPPWRALSDLAADIGVPELEDVADIMRLSGEEGVAVYDNLRSRSRGMRAALLTREQARANADSERMVVPVALLGLVFLCLLAYPALVRVL